jgi:MerR family transcriptional regulator, light-induced transcriptional regulator
MSNPTLNELDPDDDLQADAHVGPAHLRMYSVGNTARETGIAAETLRIWERRYGKPVPQRLPSGHRRFTHEQVMWLRRVAEALARGVRASKAVNASPSELDAWLAPATVEVDESWLTRAMACVERLDQDGLELLVLDGRDDMDVVTWLRMRVARLLERVGVNWASGLLDVRHEHLATEVVAHVLRREADRFNAPPEAPTIVFGTLSGEHHGLGILMASLKARVVGVGVSLASSGVDTDRAIADLRDAVGPNVQVLVGGNGARSGRRGPRGVHVVSELRELPGWFHAQASAGARPSP